MYALATTPSAFVFPGGAETTTFTGTCLPSWFDVMRTPGGPSRWRWWASGPKGCRYGDALSEAVARSRAARAMEELR